jgi:hypothetical protein
MGVGGVGGGVGTGGVVPEVQPDSLQAIFCGVALSFNQHDLLEGSKVNARQPFNKPLKQAWQQSSTVVAVL